jgi:hypothetical protein
VIFYQNMNMSWNDLWVAHFQNYGGVTHNFRCQIENQVSDYRLLGASSLNSIFLSPSWMEDGAVGHNFEMGLPKDYPCQVWFNLVQRFQRKRFKCDLLSKYA